MVQCGGCGTCTRWGVVCGAVGAVEGAGIVLKSSDALHYHISVNTFCLRTCPCPLYPKFIQALYDIQQISFMKLVKYKWSEKSIEIDLPLEFALNFEEIKWTFVIFATNWWWNFKKSGIYQIFNPDSQWNHNGPTLDPHWTYNGPTMDQYRTHKGPPMDIQQTPEVFRGSLNVIAIQKLTLLKKNHNDDKNENYGLTLSFL